MKPQTPKEQEEYAAQQEYLGFRKRWEPIFGPDGEGEGDEYHTEENNGTQGPVGPNAAATWRNATASHCF